MVEQVRISKEAQQEKRIKVLIIEDDPSITHLLRRVIGGVGGIETISTDNATDALRILREEKAKGELIGMVISDWGILGGKSGLDIAKIAKDEKLTHHFTLHSTNADEFAGESPEQQGYRNEAGLDAVFGKPTSIGTLTNHIESVKQRVRVIQASGEQTVLI